MNNNYLNSTQQQLQIWYNGGDNNLNYLNTFSIKC